MNGIYHKIGIRAAVPEIIEALTTQNGLAGWWTKEVTGSGFSAVGDSIHFQFGDKGGFDMKVTEITNNSVAWQCTAGPDDWVGSKIRFDLKASDTTSGMTLIHFRHQDWKVESEFTAHCSMKWAIFLLSLRSLIETGQGQSFPDDIKIDDMN